MSEHFVIFGRGLCDSRDWLFGDDQHMRGRLGFDIAKCQHEVVFINDCRRDFAGNNFFEKRFAHVLPTCFAAPAPSTGTKPRIKVSSWERWRLAGAFDVCYQLAGETPALPEFRCARKVR